MGSLKKILQRIVSKSGFEIRRISSRRTSIRESYFLLSGLGFCPKTVIDVGVAAGTLDLYESFPEAHMLLVEPLAQFEPRLREILNKYKGSYLIAAAAAENKTIEFNVHPDHLEGSSLYKETMGEEADGYKVMVPTVVLDDLIQERELKGPYLLKVDTQGAELDVLDGASKTLHETDVVVLETSLFQFMKGAPQFCDVVAYMKKIGFVVYDIINLGNRPFDNALAQVDIVFVKENGLFRRDHSYSKPM